MFLIVKHLGNPVLVLEGAVLSDLARHVASGYPDLVPELAAGHVTGEETESLDGITLSPLPETVALADRKILAAGVRVLLNHENRLRALENKPEITITQFRAALKNLLEL